MLALMLAACGRVEPDGTQPDLTAAVASPPPPAAPAAVDPAPAAAPKRAPAAPAAAGEDWNDTQIDWQSYDAGMALARAKNKPVCLVLYTGWCPHCKNYSRIFADPKIVQRARDFVMIRVNADENEEVNKRYARDGGYVPRTFFVAPDGVIAEEIHAARPKYLYFFDESNPASLLGGMEAMLKKVGRAG